MKILRLFLILFCSIQFCGLSAQSPEGKKLVILHTNDLHSQLNGFSPEIEYTPFTLKNDHTMGGFSRMATLLREEREKNGDNLLVVSCGDFLMGTFFANLEESTGFQLPLMKKMGYDVVSLGNHEFDFGPQALAGILRQSASNGPVPQLVFSNITFSAEDSADDSLKALFDRAMIKPYLVVEKNGLKLGIFGILGYGATGDAPLARPVTFPDPVKTAKKYVQILKETEKVDLVICLSHSGVSKDKKGNWAGEDVRLAQKVPGIDLLISGHTHTWLGEPILVNNIPVVQAGASGTGIGRVELEMDEGNPRLVKSEIIPVNDNIPGDMQIQHQINLQEKKISETILKSMNLSYSAAVAETAFPLLYNQDTLLEKSNLGPLVADAVYTYVNRHNQPGADVVLYPAGLIRDNIISGNKGKQSVADIFRVVSMGSGNDRIPGYPLARIWVTGKELKGIMEILYLAPSSNRDNYIYFGGLRATYNHRKGLLKKITSIETGNPGKGFEPVDWSKKNKKLYSIAANSYVLEFIPLIKKLSMGLVKVSLKDEKGNPLNSIADAVIDADPIAPGVQEMKEWKALVWFLQNQPDINGNGIPDVPDMYRTGNPKLTEEK